MALTLAQYRASYPEFASIDDAIVQRYLTEFTILYQGCYGEYYDMLQGYYVSHMLAMFYNVATGQASGTGATGGIKVIPTSRSVGDVSVSGQAVGINTSDPSYWDGTVYGQRFWSIISAFGGGPYLTGVSYGYGC